MRSSSTKLVKVQFTDYVEVDSFSSPDDVERQMEEGLSYFGSKYFDLMNIMDGQQTIEAFDIDLEEA